MSQITLTLEMTPNNLAILAEVLPRFEMCKPYSTELASMGTPNLSLPENAVTGDDTPKVPEERKTTAAKPKAGKPKEAAPDTPASKPEANTADATKAPDKTDVRAVALKLSKAGRQDALKEIFAKYGADKLSGIAEADYPALLEDLEAANAES